MKWWFSDPEEKKVLDQIEKDSDRAAAIVIAVIIERRLTQQIEARLHKHPKIHKQLFRTSGPLGSFSAKIDLAHILGILSAEAHRDLVTTKDIRNAFAHYLDITNFKSQRIRDLCFNLKLVEKHVVEGSVLEFRASRKTAKEDFKVLIGVSDRAAILSDPRSRYLTSALMFDMLLRLRRSGDPGPPKPLF
jgi:DNA-binding MltR family transcriptional regulator